MRRLSLVVALAAAVALLAPSLLSAQAGGARGGMRGGRGGGAGGQSAAERISAALDSLGLTAAEKAAAEKAIDAKMKAHQELRTQYEKLQAVAANKNATQKELTSAYDQYIKAVDRYHSVVRDQDRALAAKLSARSKVAALEAGVLDNGMGMGGRRGGGGGGGGGGGMRGGGGGMRRGGGGGARGG